MNFFLLETAPAPSGGAGAFINGLFPILLIIIVMYFFLLRPQTKRQREETAFRESLKNGDKIITIGGIYGRVVSMEETSVIIEVDKDVKLKMAKEAIRPAPNNEPAK